MTEPVHKRYEFGTVFGDGGRITAEAKREKKYYTPEEVEILRANAYKDGQSDATARAQMAQAQSVQALADAAHAGLTQLTEAIASHKSAGVKLALTCAQKIAAEALDRFPEAPMQAALEALGQELESATRLVLFSANPDEALQTAANEAAALCGFTGAIQFRAQPAFPKGAFEVVWNDGRAEYNPQHVFEVLEHALNEAIEADLYHQTRARDESGH